MVSRSYRWLAGQGISAAGLRSQQLDFEFVAGSFSCRSAVFPVRPGIAVCAGEESLCGDIGP